MGRWRLVACACLLVACGEEAPTGGSGAEGIGQMGSPVFADATCGAGLVEACPCGAAMGSRTCQTDGSWGACDCTGGPPPPTAGGTGGVMVTSLGVSSN